ncbi:MAG: endonuclease [Flavobacterium psychrophilum]|nr:MAG: endonuclease [Flavobacterium psychrophilum]
MIKNYLTLAFIISSLFKLQAQEKQYKVHTIAFYNVENFYDTINDPKTNDEEWVYTSKNFKKKVNNLAKVISTIGTDENPNSPTVIGLGEIENRRVLEALVKDPQLVSKDYGIIQFDSPDRRGIDTALLYQKKYFEPTSFINIPLYIYDDFAKPESKAKDVAIDKVDSEDNAEVDKQSNRIYTRDQLLVTGLLDGEEISFIVNHWPSRRGGEAASSHLREAAAALNVKTIDSLYKINPDLKLITMGDLNDGPYNKSIKKVLGAKSKKEEVKPHGMFNPMEEMSKNGVGTLAYRDAWDLFDQMILTEPLIRKDYSSYRYWKAGVFKKPYMLQSSGQYKGYPNRNWNGDIGYSDHLPVYLYLVKQK